MASCLGCYFVGGAKVGAGIVTEPFRVLPLNCASGVIDITATVTSLLFTISRSRDHACVSIQILVTADTMNTVPAAEG